MFSGSGFSARERSKVGHHVRLLLSLHGSQHATNPSRTKEAALAPAITPSFQREGGKKSKEMFTSPTTRQFYGSLELLPTPDLEGPLSCRGSHTHVATRPAAKDEPRTVVPRPCAAPEACGHCSLSGDLTDAALPKWREGSLCAQWTPSPAEASRQSVVGEGWRVRRG